MTLREYLKRIANTIRHHLSMSEDEKINAQDFTSHIDTVAEANWESGYNSGYERGHDEGGEYHYNEGYSSGFNNGLMEGKQAAYDAFWDAYQANGNRTSYEHAFAGKGWTRENFRPKYDIRPVNSYMMFQNSSIKGDIVQILEDCGVILDMSLCSGWVQYPFSGLLASRLGVIDFSNVVMLYEPFGNCINLHTIDELILSKDCEETTAFRGCTSLANLKISGEIGKPFNFQWCPLTKASITSVINALSTTTSGLTVTFSLTAVNNAFTGGSTGSEWQALIATKPNWTISLV